MIHPSIEIIPNNSCLHVIQVGEWTSKERINAILQAIMFLEHSDCSQYSPDEKAKLTEQLKKDYYNIKTIKENR